MNAETRREFQRNLGEYERLAGLGARFRRGVTIFHDGRPEVRYPTGVPKGAVRDYQDRNPGIHFMAIYVDKDGTHGILKVR